MFQLRRKIKVGWLVCLGVLGFYLMLYVKYAIFARFHHINPFPGFRFLLFSSLALVFMLGVFVLFAWLMTRFLNDQFQHLPPELRHAVPRAFTIREYFFSEWRNKIFREAAQYFVALSEEKHQLQEKHELILTTLGVGYWEEDFVTQQLYLSPNLCEMLGVAPATILPSGALSPGTALGWLDIVPEEYRDALIAERHAAAQAQQEHATFLVPYRDATQTLRWLRSSAKAQFSPTGDLVSACGICMEVTEEIAAKEQLASHQQEMAVLQQETRQLQMKTEIILDLAKVGCWEADLTTGQVWWSDQLYTLLGIDPATYTPKLGSWEALLPDHERERVVTYQRLIKVKQQATFSIEFSMTRHGQIRRIRKQGRYQYGPGGTPIYSCGLYTDMTEQLATETLLHHQQAYIGQLKQKHHLLRQEQRHLRTTREVLLNTAGIGEWEHHLLTQQSYWSPGMYGLYGLDPDTFPLTADSWLTFIPAAFRDDAIHRVYDHRRMHQNTLVLEYPYMRQQERRWMRDCGWTEYDAEGEAVRIYGICFDVTREKADSQQIQRQTTTLKRLSHEHTHLQAKVQVFLKYANVGYWEENFRDQTVYWTPSLYALAGIPPQTPLKLRAWTQLLAPDTLEAVMEQIETTLQQQQPELCLDIPFLRQQDSRWVRNNIRYLYTQDGAVEFACGIVTDITEEKHFHTFLREDVAFFDNQWFYDHTLRRQIEQLSGFFGRDASLNAFYHKVNQAAQSSYPVLITGETGTGKELIARTVHKLSDRKTAPFLPINCAALPAALVESELFGHKRGAFTGAVKDHQGVFSTLGTVFLDEINSLSLDMQAKFLRAVEYGIRPVGSHDEHPLICRIIVATNQDLWSVVQAGHFREDLYYRLNTIRLEIPPLRAHPADIPFLVMRFCQELGLDRPIPEEVILHWRQAVWPGNVRELRHAVEQYAVFRHWQSPTRQPFSLDTALKQYEQHLITTTLQLYKGNRTQTAQALGISERTLYRKLLDRPN